MSEPNGLGEHRAIESLLDEVRRALGLQGLARALRLLAWAWAVLLALAAVAAALTGAHALGLAIGLGALAAAMALAWGLAARPSAARAAAHLDCQLGGESAFTTWLELRAAGRLQEPAGRHLTTWTAARVPARRLALARGREPWRIARPLAAAGVCALAALAADRLAMPRPAGEARTATPAAGSSAPAEAARLDDDGLADSLAAALAKPGRGAVDPQASEDRATTNRPDSTGQSADGRAVNDDDSRASRPAAAQGSAPGAGSGREAGTTRDDGAQSATRRAPEALLEARRRALGLAANEREALADDARVGSYATGADAAAGAVATGLQPAAARPPAARPRFALTPAASAYVVAASGAMQRENEDAR